MSTLKKVASAVVCLLAAVFLTAWYSWSPGAPVYPSTAQLRSIELPARMRTWPEHDAIRSDPRWDDEPYVIEVKSDKGALVFFGAHHTSNPDDPQFAQLQQRWDALKPTVALTEGRRNGYFVGPMYRLGGTPEPEVVHQLARRDGVRLVSLEPSYADEVALLRQTWSPEQIATYFTMRVYWSESGGKADEKLAMHLLKKRTNVDGLRGSVASPADIDRVWKAHYASLGDWRTRKEEPREGWWARISDDSRRIRGEHMARTLIDLTRKGERVFAVVGSGHVIRTEWMVRGALEE